MSLITKVLNPAQWEEKHNVDAVRQYQEINCY